MSSLGVFMRVRATLGELVHSGLPVMRGPAAIRAFLAPMTELCIAAAMLVMPAAAPRAQWTPQTSNSSADLRGLSVVSSRVVWASGSGGTVLRTIDGGATWRADSVPGAAALDFRDIEAFDAQTAYVMSAGNGALSRIYKTVDGGAHWMLQFTNADSAGFYDAMGFWDREHGVAMSDPVDGRFVIITTTDGGKTWKKSAAASMPSALKGEGGFASSGTCLVAAGEREAWFATGGASASRVFHSGDRGQTWSVAETPVAAASASRGIFSLAFGDARTGYAIGGDYQKPQTDSATVAVTRDAGKTWALAAGRTHGYRSGLAMRGKMLIAVGINGTDRSADGGATWTLVDRVEYNSVSFGKGQRQGWAVGPQGRIARWSGAQER
ncbi:MAG: glycosyl hydrolase [Gemmatimonadota bacterium]|nr:glycosyl hydrolase [Gemmatimonadota bacterium]